MRKRNWLNIIFAILLPLVVGVNIYQLHQNAANNQKLTVLTMQNQRVLAQNQADTIQIETQVKCIGSYFNTQGRTGNTTLSDLDTCSAALEGLQK